VAPPRLSYQLRILNSGPHDIHREISVVRSTRLSHGANYLSRKGSYF